MECTDLPLRLDHRVSDTRSLIPFPPLWTRTTDTPSTSIQSWSLCCGVVGGNQWRHLSVGSAAVAVTESPSEPVTRRSGFCGCAFDDQFRSL